jgi:hypothetical protein
MNENQQKNLQCKYTCKDLWYRSYYTRI